MTDVTVSQLFALAAVELDVDVKVTQLFALAAVTDHPVRPQLRAWTYTLDGHDYYVLLLGEVETLVYDLYSKKWSVFAHGTTDRWNLNVGINWADVGAFSADYGSNVVCGDESTGTLYFLDPEYPYDDNPTTGEVGRSTFERVAQGQIVHRGPDLLPCYGVALTGSFGDSYDGVFNTITLYTSDDAGRGYQSAGILEVTDTDYDARIEWLSLGSINAPGRLFKIVDYGALARVDGLEHLDAKS